MPPDAVFVLIPLTGTVLGISLAMLAVYLHYKRRTEALRLAHAERMAAIEKGIELPPPAVRLSHVEEAPRSTVSRQRSSGLILVFVGAAITLALWQTGDGEFWWGLVPVAVGLAQLLSAVLEPRPPAPPGPGDRPPGA